MIEKKKNYLSMNDDEFLFEYTNIAANISTKNLIGSDFDYDFDCHNYGYLENAV